MGFRDEREADQQRIDSLEKELARKEQELEALKGGAPPPPQVPLRRSNAGLVAGLAAAGVVLLGVLLLQYNTHQARLRAARAELDTQEAEANARREAEQRARARERELANEAQVRRAMEEDRERARAASLGAELASARVSTRWTGVLREAQGLSVPAGAECALEGTFAGRANVRAESLRLRCGGAVLFTLATGPGAPAPERLSLREGPVFQSAAHVYQLSFLGPGEGAEGGQLEVSTLRHQAVLLRPGGRARVELADVSEPAEGPSVGQAHAMRAPDFAGLEAFDARVTSTRGNAGVQRSARCSVQARPVWEYPENCRLFVQCDGRVLYGDREAGYLTCEVRDGRAVGARDDNNTDHGGDPQLHWSGAAIEVRDYTSAGEWAVNLALTPRRR